MPTPDAKVIRMPLAELKNATAAGGKLQSDSLVWRFDNPVRVKAGSLPWLFPHGDGFGRQLRGVDDDDTITGSHEARVATA